MKKLHQLAKRHDSTLRNIFAASKPTLKRFAKKNEKNHFPNSSREKEGKKKHPKKKIVLGY